MDVSRPPRRTHHRSRAATRLGSIAAIGLALAIVGCGGLGSTQEQATTSTTPGDPPDAVAHDDRGGATLDEDHDDAGERGPDDAPAGGSDVTTGGGAEPPDAGPPTPLDGRHRIHLDGQVVEVLLTDGRGQLPDGRLLELDAQLVARGDLTGDGREEVVAAGRVLPAVGDEPGVPVLSVRTDDGPIDPPEVDLPDLDLGTAPIVTWVRAPVDDGRITALGLHDGGIEARVEAPLRGVLPPPEGPRLPYEQRWVRRGDDWSGSNDGPVTRAARGAVAASEVLWAAGDTILCGELPGPRGTTTSCSELTTDGPARVTLLFVDDALGYRIQVARDALLTGEDVAMVLGDQARCSDILELAETGFPAPVVPFAAIAYWFHQGRPDRMDASGEGRPCATVWPDAAELLHGGIDGRVVDHYQATLP